MSKPLQISADTAIKLSEQLGVPIEHLMHMPRHILLQKLASLNSGALSDTPDKADYTPAKPAEGEGGKTGEQGHVNASVEDKTDGSGQ
ncbi:hypothetical protein A7K91_24270 [Paenibacillus oryzae]|uniref:YycC family protein n=1 Tax=Paenibacillus oryzae TaxID=1844972 RepID=A0A1A5YL47_9BACL|nr:hypothetical protein A7K91_24270 [Paenibacillus oryzae]